jgi:hypothetical protein
VVATALAGRRESKGPPSTDASEGAPDPKCAVQACPLVIRAMCGQQRKLCKLLPVPPPSRASHPPPQPLGQQACVPVTAVAGARSAAGMHGGAPACQSSLELVRSTPCCTHSHDRCAFWQGPIACLHCKHAASAVATWQLICMHQCRLLCSGTTQASSKLNHT